MWRPIQDLFPTAWSEHIQELKRGEDGGSRKRGGAGGRSWIEDWPVCLMMGPMWLACWSRPTILSATQALSHIGWSAGHQLQLMANRREAG